MKATYATDIVKKLRQEGHQAYFVGGCVRDMVMGIEPSDYDIATSARPKEVLKIFPRTEPIGAKFGVVLVIQAGVPFEVATFRSDEAYIDGRRPTGVVFTNPEEDVQRRDFTINGLLYDPIEERVLDYVNGQADITARIVRAIGNPQKRFEEDKLRVLRAIRFGARLGYTIEDATWTAVQSMASQITQVSSERIRDELMRILTEGDAPRGMEMLDLSGLREHILPELEWTEHLSRCLEKIGAGGDADFAISVCLHECAISDVERIADRLRFSNAQRSYITALVGSLPLFRGVQEMTRSRLKKFLRTRRFEDQSKLFRIHLEAENADTFAIDWVQGKLRSWSESDLHPEPLITGEDLIRFGMNPGPSFRRILTAVEDEQLEERLTNRDQALDFVRQHFQDRSGNEIIPDSGDPGKPEYGNS